MWIHELKGNVVWQRETLLVKHAFAFHLFENKLLSPVVAIIHRFRAFCLFHKVIIQPLHTLHIELKPAITQLFEVWDSKL